MLLDFDYWDPHRAELVHVVFYLLVLLHKDTFIVDIAVEEAGEVQA